MPARKPGLRYELFSIGVFVRNTAPPTGGMGCSSGGGLFLCVWILRPKHRERPWSHTKKRRNLIASALLWVDVNLDSGTARIRRSFSDGKTLSTTKTGRERTVELSSRVLAALAESKPDIVGGESLVFPNRSGGFIDPHNFRARAFRRIVERALGPNRDFSPHGLRHTFASLHLALGTNIKWLQNMGGWASAKLLLDLYGHFLPTESTGFADAIGGSKRQYTAPKQRAVAASSRVTAKRRARPKGLMAPREGFARSLRSLSKSRGGFRHARRHENRAIWMAQWHPGRDLNPRPAA